MSAMRGSLAVEAGEGERIEELAAPEKIAIGFAEISLGANHISVFPDAGQLRFDKVMASSPGTRK
jgi:hypothetical protein